MHPSCAAHTCSLIAMTQLHCINWTLQNTDDECEYGNIPECPGV